MQPQLFILHLQTLFALSDITSIEGGDHYRASAFSGCSSLENIYYASDINSWVQISGLEYFRDCSKLEYNTYDNAYYLGNDNNPYLWLIDTINTSITSCTINSDTKFIYYDAFYDCSKLTSIIIPDKVTSIGEDAFRYCSSLEYNTYDNAYYLGNDNNPYLLLVKAKNTSITSCTINSNTKFIHSGAFVDCSSLTSITIPDKVTSIGSSAFYGCRSLTSITIPDKVTSIGDYAFGYCSKLTSVTIGNGVTSIGAFRGCSSLENIYYTGDINSWVQISGLYNLMSDGKSSKNLYINGTLLTEANITTATSINSYAFYYYDKLTKVTIGDQVTSIGDYAFYDCDSLTSVTIGNGVTSIGYEAFCSCSSLTSVTIGNGVTSIGRYAFYGCRSLTSVTFENTSGWYIVDYSDETSGIDMDVTDSSQNATYLKSTCCDYYWKRK